MASIEGRFCVVLCVAIVMLFSVNDRLAAQELDAPSIVQPAIFQSAVVSPVPARPTLARRPSVLVPLYVSFSAMQAMDIHSTQKALGHGGREANPMLGAVVGSPVVLTALKVGATAGIILMTEKLQKRSRVAAVVMMVTLNSAYAMVVAHNYSVAR